MNTKLIIYRLITFTILPIAGILGFIDVVALVSSFSNPTALFGVFILASLVIYVFTSFVFFSQGVMNGKIFKASLKDWIKVNAFVTVIYWGIVLISIILFFTMPSFQKMAMDQINAMRTSAQSTIGDREGLVNVVKKGMLVFAAFAAVLIVHVVITFGLLKKYKYLFSKPG